MLTSEMHKMFLAIGQSKGLDTVRFITNESIDVYLNNALLKKIRSIYYDVASAKYSDKQTLQHNPISGTNALKSLYREKNIVIDFYDAYNPAVHIKDGFSLCIDIDCMFIYYARLTYNRNEEKETYRCRIIDLDSFDDISLDYCNAPSYKYPILTYRQGITFNIDEDTTVNGLQIDCKYKTTSKPFPTSKSPNSIQISYVASPTPISYDGVTDSNVDDVPDYIYNEVVEIAVNDYFKSIGATSQNVEQTNRQQ